jgi:circadian clock protein KaiB
MTKPDSAKTTRRYERALQKQKEEVYVLSLFVAGATSASQRALKNVKALCEQRLKGRYQLEVIDIYQHPGLARGLQILAAPTLIRVLPTPLRRFIGDMTRAERVLLRLGPSSEARASKD